jgi:hypothetical protein
MERKKMMGENLERRPSQVRAASPLLESETTAESEESISKKILRAPARSASARALPFRRDWDGSDHALELKSGGHGWR